MSPAGSEGKYSIKICYKRWVSRLSDLNLHFPRKNRNQVKHISHGGLDSNSVKEGQEMLVPAGCSQCPLVSFFFFFFLFSTLRRGHQFWKVWPVAW